MRRVPTGTVRTAVVGLAWVVAFLLPALLPRHALLVNEVVIVALFALSLDLVLGYAGIVSLGHAAFFGAGAYAAGLFARHVAADPLAGLAVAAATGAGLGAAAGLTVRRGTDLSRLMVTLGAALLLLETANSASGLTGGADGLQGIVPRPLLGLFAFDLYGRTAAWYSLAVLLAAVLLVGRVVRSPFGISLQALRDDPRRAEAIGIPVGRRIVCAYTLAATLAAIAGGLLAQTAGVVSLDVLAFHRSAEVLLAVVIGGAGWLYGGIVGAVVLKLLQDALSALTPQYWMFWLGLVMVVLALAGRDRWRLRLPGRGHGA
ncbi:branched-chain amino acid ABC transporter permease [uncultured Xylophilus sp.]|uniref:branched-chain amino acid ABC transporter permease n=1 Tax=uncultured Xylophilus sp. TaxID=296832 RepID=UPI0025D0A638|nr:branched-chain amino acid ABC transporter permease [uncultured Xylophilus sp.]